MGHNVPCSKEAGRAIKCCVQRSGWVIKGVSFYVRVYKGVRAYVMYTKLYIYLGCILYLIFL